jgi:hypothetical protein
MCMMVYLAADLPLRPIPWDEGAPAFNTTPLAPTEERVRRQFGRAHLLYAGSHEGCGCGFQLGQYPTDRTEPDERARRRESLRALAASLREEVARAGPIELYACWDGDQEAPPAHRRALTPSAVDADTFFFLEKELSVVSGD